MNIIQLQDRLKGVPDQALVGYVENPTGEVPTYLALGELQRRKDMRERYQANKQPELSVAEQLIQETKPQGIATMMPGMTPPNQGVGTPQPQPEMTPNMMASSGVGALPAGNIGQNYAGGGIVAFEDGGEVEDEEGPVIYEDGSEGYIAGGLLGLGGRTLTGLRNFLLGRKAVPEIPTPTKELDVLGRLTGVRGPVAGPGRPGVPGTRGVIGVLKDNPKTTVLGTAGAYYVLSDDDPDNATVIPVADDQVQLVDAGVAAGIAAEGGEQKILSDYNPPKLDLSSLRVDDPTQYGRDKMAAVKKFIGEDTVSPRLEKRLADLEAGLQGQKDVAPYMALTEAGLAIAAGESPNAITNIAQGATRGLKSYTEELKDIRSREEKMFDIDTEIQKAKRAEQVAIGTKGFDSMEAAEARNRTMELEMQKASLQQYEAERDRETKIEAAKISSMYGTPGGYYGFKGLQAINKAIESDKVIQDIDRQIYTLSSGSNVTEEKRKAIARLEIQKQRRLDEIQARYGVNSQGTNIQTTPRQMLPEELQQFKITPIE